MKWQHTSYGWGKCPQIAVVQSMDIFTYGSSYDSASTSPLICYHITHNNYNIKSVFLIISLCILLYVVHIHQPIDCLHSKKKKKKSMLICHPYGRCSVWGGWLSCWEQVRERVCTLHELGRHRRWAGGSVVENRWENGCVPVQMRPFTLSAVLWSGCGMGGRQVG